MFVYILRCRDGAYYTGSTRATLEERVTQHQCGKYDGWTAKRLPVALVWHQEFQSIRDGVAAERQIKGWGRAKKEALIRGDLAALTLLAKRPHPETALT